MLMDLDVKM